VRIPLVALLAVSALVGSAWSADAGAAPAPAPAAGGGTPPAGNPPAAADQKPFLGVQVDPNGVFDSGVPVSVVVPGGTAAAMGMLSGDIITAINKQPTLKAEDIKKAVENLKVGDPVVVEIKRKEDKLSLSGVMQAKPAPPKSNAEMLAELKAQAAALQQRKDREPSLAEMLDDIVTKLNELEKNLPKAAEAFKKVYPNGEFSITISITISSDKTAKNAVLLGNQGDKKDDAKKDPDPAKDASAPKPPPAPAPTPQPKP
jgi:hypothetical protein